MQNKLVFRNPVAAAGSVLLLATLTACVLEVPGPRSRVLVAPPPVVLVAPAVVVQENYVYYPQYEVYYSSSRQLYFYLDGNVWVSKPAPPRVEIKVLLASPSIQMDFHDSPEAHHGAVVKNYPQTWTPPGRGRGRGRGGD